jgi:hypothetical protein
MSRKSSGTILVGLAAALGASVIATGVAVYGGAHPHLSVGRTTVTQLAGSGATGLFELSTPLRNLGIRTASLEKVEVEVFPKNSGAVVTPSDWDQVGIHPLQRFDERIDLVVQQDENSAPPRYLRLHFVDADGNHFKRDLAVSCKDGQPVLVDVLDAAKQGDSAALTPLSRDGLCPTQT